MRKRELSRKQLLDELNQLRRRLADLEPETAPPRAVAEQERAEAAQCESEQRFRSLFENSPDAIFVEDLAGNVLDVNPAACRLHRVEREALVGRNVQTLVPPDQRERALEGFARLVEGDLKHVEGYSWTADGQAVPVELRASRITYAGQPAVLLHVRDITMHKRSEQALIEAKERAEEMSRLKSSFLNNMSHEIRTPLTAIIGFSGILAQEASEQQKELVELIEHSGKRLLNTLNAVLDLSMLEAGSLMLEREWLGVVEVVREKVEAARSLAREKGVRLAVNAAAEVHAYLDRACLDRIVTHLLDNAIKFTEEGCVTVCVCTEAARFRICVADTGVGICETFQPHLFDAFKQESTGVMRSHVGAGLGLAIVKRMATLMNGEVTVRSEKHKGSVFEVSFPLAVAAQAAFLPAGVVNGHAAAVHRRPHILVVEDNPEIALLLQHMLGESYDLEAAPNEEGALGLARQTPFDLVLMDINLGSERTGEDVLAALRRMPRYANVPVVAMTAYALLEDRERFLEAGFDGYLSKPFTTSQLEKIILQLLGVPALLPAQVRSARAVPGT